ncbi:MAG TPA: transposase [Rubrobacter sp.]|nr:transposase [Rubrobacter sp.]
MRLGGAESVPATPPGRRSRKKLVQAALSAPGALGHQVLAPLGKSDFVPCSHTSLELLRTLEGKLLVVWDGSPIHRGWAAKDFLGSGVSWRLQLEQLPGYAPELNPDEGICKHLKNVELKNLCCQSLSELRVELRKAKERLRHKRDVILGCIRQPGFEV